MSDIKITVEDRDGHTMELMAPTDMGLSLMEFLKANEYDILVTCGGIALCATCCVDVLEGEDKLREMTDVEYTMLDTLPDLQSNSRLACQIPLTPEMDGLRIRIHPQNN